MTATRLVVCVNERLGPNQKSCAGSGSRELIRLLQQRFIQEGLQIAVDEQVCLGRCAEGIAMRIAPGGPFFTDVTENNIPAIVKALREFVPPGSSSVISPEC
ncbi:MAG: (2Fe-2S) ferredoxin domain-containing protein [Gammaproteobacteria bacterium]|nr:(2Fe-2S) ferredoxin domain-containing protein [Gammaproteobacteria bacterium]MBL7000690.1 (2Fe-2S) ferredoxin domain-containing protein [Gammaproteobacteria bacterium]